MQGPATKRQLMNVRDAAAYTGLSVRTLYTMASQRRVPYIKVGRLTKFDLIQLNDWIDKHTVMPLAPKAVVS
jgi:excisionase family DNA binding protein